MGYPGQSNRERNHERWEDRNPRQAIRAKGREAVRQRAESATRTPQTRNQRNNRREY
jgi:hypothetical protein